MRYKEKESVPCPACGRMMHPDSLIFHMRKKAVFEVYDWFNKRPIDQISFEKECPHEFYIRANQTLEPKFSIE